MVYYQQFGFLVFLTRAELVFELVLVTRVLFSENGVPSKEHYR